MGEWRERKEGRQGKEGKERGGQKRRGSTRD